MKICKLNIEAFQALSKFVFYALCIFDYELLVRQNKKFDNITLGFSKKGWAFPYRTND